MSVRVNLLPAQIKSDARAQNAQRVAVLVGLAGIVALGVLWAIFQARISAAEDDLAAAQAETAELSRQRGALNEFQALANLADQADAGIRLVLGEEISLAGVLQDVASVMPSDSSLSSLAIDLDVDEGQLAAEVRATGESLFGHSPGLERLLLSFGKVMAFEDAFFSQSQLDENGIAVFDFDFVVTNEAVTGRYANGLPEELR